MSNFFEESNQDCAALERQIRTAMKNGMLLDDIEAVFAKVKGELQGQTRKDYFTPVRGAASPTEHWLEKRKPTTHEREHKPTVGVDHTSMWKDKDTGDRVVITEPYSLNSHRIRDLAALANKGYEIFVDAESSSYYPGKTLYIEIRKGS